jgi:hypothetical protein
VGDGRRVFGGVHNVQWEAEQHAAHGRTPLQRATITLHQTIKVPIMFGTTVEATTTLQFRCTVAQVSQFAQELNRMKALLLRNTKSPSMGSKALAGS